MKKFLFLFAFLFIALAIFADVTVVSDVPATAPLAAKAPFTSLVVITEVMAGVILTWTQGIKRLLESPILKWVLMIIGHSEVVPFIGVALSILTAIITGVIAYQSGGITIGEIILMIPAAWGQAIGAHALIGKASGVQTLKVQTMTTDTCDLIKHTIKK